MYGSPRSVGNELHSKWTLSVLLSTTSAQRKLLVGSERTASTDTEVNSDRRSICVSSEPITDHVKTSVLLNDSSISDHVSRMLFVVSEY